MSLFDQHGLVTLPAKPDKKGSIHPPFPYKAHYDKRPSRAELSAIWATREAGHDPFILTGKYYDLIVIDIDSETAHRTFLQRIAIPEGTPCETTKKGWHYFFRWPTDFDSRLSGTNAGLLGKGLDVLGSHAGVHSGPAIHKPRTWTVPIVGGNIPPCPVELGSWIEEALAGKRTGPCPKPGRNGKEEREPFGGNGDEANPSNDAYRLANGPVSEGDRHAAALALTGALSGAGARPDRVRTWLLAANRRHSQPPLPQEEIERIVTDITAKDAEKRDGEDEDEDATDGTAPLPPSDGQDVGRKTPRRKRSAGKAVMALLRAGVVNPKYTPSSHQLRGIWLLSGNSVCWSVCNASRLAMEMVDGGFGGLRAFALDLDPRARDADVVTTLQFLTKHAEREDDDPMSEKLICAALAMPVLRLGDKASGIQLERPLSAEPGVYREHGVSLKQVKAVWTLAINMPTAAAYFSKHPDLGFGRRSSDELVRILMSSARKVTRKKNVALPGVSYHLDVADLMNPTDDDAASSESKQGGGVASDDSDDTTKAKAPPR